MRKVRVKYETDLGYEATLDQITQSPIVSTFYENKGRLTFILKNLRDAKFQVTTNSILQIWYPENIDKDFFLNKAKPLLLKADGTPVDMIKIIHESKEKSKKSVSKYKYSKRLLNHSKRLVLTDEYQGFEHINRAAVIDFLAFHDRVNRDSHYILVYSCFLQHLETGYHDDIYLPLMEYRNKMIDSGWADRETIPRLYGNFGVTPEEEDPVKFRELESMRIVLENKVNDLINLIKMDEPLDGTCTICEKY